MHVTNRGARFVRYDLTPLTVMALWDGYVDMPPSRLRHDGGQPFGVDFPKQIPLIDGQLRLSVNAFLVIENGRHILMDTGAGNAWLPTMGLLHAALAEAGVSRESIDTIALTHTHTDHVNGLLTPDGSDAFPSLQRIYVPEQEVAIFETKERLTRFRRLCVPFGDGFKVTGRITSLQAHGHSVGHSAFAVSGDLDTLLVCGDFVHVPSVQFGKPDLTWEFDRDQGQARSARLKLLAHAAAPDVAVAGAHLDFPGIGRVSRAGDAYRFSEIE